jgi:hypothetical protein
VELDLSLAKVASIADSQRRTRLLWIAAGSFLSFVLPFAVYLRTLAPTVYGLDSAELTLGAYSLGLVHSPGYPLYLLIGHLFTLLPLGDVGYRVNLMSAFCGALTIALLYHLLLHLTRRSLASLSASLLLAFSFFFWSPSLMAEVYSLHVFLMAALMLILVVWQQRRDSRWLYLFALLFGLGLGNHLSMLLLLPGFLYWLLAVGRIDHRHDGRGQLLQARQLPGMLALLALGLSVYLYLPLRYAAQARAAGAMQIQAASWQETINIVSGRAFWGLVFAYRGAEIWPQVADYLYCLWGNFLGVGLLLGLVGCVAAFRRWRHLTIALALIFLANAVFFIGYGAADKRIMFLPTYLVWAVWLGLGYDRFADWADSLAKDASGLERWPKAVQVLFPCLVMVALVVNFPHADLSDDRRTYEQAARILETVEPGAYVLATHWFEVAPLGYLKVVERRRPDVTVLHGYEITPAELAALIESEGDAHPFYSTADPGWLAGAARYRLEYIQECDCYRIR